jgi:hypothetical protein
VRTSRACFGCSSTWWSTRSWIQTERPQVRILSPEACQRCFLARVGEWHSRPAQTRGRKTMQVRVLPRAPRVRFPRSTRSRSSASRGAAGFFVKHVREARPKRFACLVASGSLLTSETVSRGFDSHRPLLWGRSSTAERQSGTNLSVNITRPDGRGRTPFAGDASRAAESRREPGIEALFLADGGHRHGDRRRAPTRAPRFRAAPAP